MLVDYKDGEAWARRSKYGFHQKQVMFVIYCILSESNMYKKSQSPDNPMPLRYAQTSNDSITPSYNAISESPIQLSCITTSPFLNLSASPFSADSSGGCSKAL